MSIETPSWFCLLALAAGAVQHAAPGTAAAGNGHAFVATAQTEQVPECSGVAAGAVTPDVYWTHNDSGPYQPRVYAFRLSAADRQAGLAPHLGYVELTGAKITDCEDIAAGPDHTIYLFDGGDNPPCERSDKRIYRFIEPKLEAPPKTTALNVKWQAIRFEYPSAADPARPAARDEERYDAECLLVHPRSGDIYVVTKRDNQSAPIARVYKLPGPSTAWNGPKVHILKLMGDCSGPAGVSANFLSAITGGDCAPDGRSIVLRSYLAAYEFNLPSGQPFEEIFQQRPQVVSLFGEPQGEGICYSRDGREFVTTSEILRFGGKRFPVYVTPRPLPSAKGSRPATKTSR